MRQIISRYITLSFQDFKNRTKVIRTYKFLLKSQEWSIEELELYQLEKLKKLINHSYQNVPFYRDLFDKNRIKPDNINSLDDINLIPVITKEDVRNAGSKIYSNNYNKGKVVFSKTGGTTGIPLHLIRDINDYSFTWGAYYRWMNWMDINIGGNTIKIWGTNTVLQSSWKNKLYNSIKNLFYNRTLVNSFNINERVLPDIIKLLNSKKPTFIRGYLSALIQISEYLLSNNISLSFKPKALSSTTETLLPPFRAVLEKAFSAPVFDQYGCGECNSIAYECKAHGGLHVVNEHVLVQILDENNNAVLNKDGKMVITNLDNYAMPFIRYENGDSAIFSDQLCSCGMKHPLLKMINGRTADTITLKDGSKVHGVFFTDILDELFEKQNIIFKRFQVYQNKPGYIEFRLESKVSVPENFKQLLLDALMRFFNNVVIKEVEKLDFDKSNKFRYVISDLK